jgi:hypothetical protein
MEAASVLCPGPAQLYLEGGSAVDAAMQDEMGAWASLLDPTPDDWLAQKLLKALSTRSDLVLTGRDLARGMHAPRFPIPQDVLVVSGSEPGALQSESRIYLTLRLRSGRAEIAYSFQDQRDQHPKDFELVEVRIERVAFLQPGYTPSGPAASPTPSPQAPKPRYTPEACRAWFLLRTKTWPADARPSTVGECLTAARAHFAGEIPRDPFRELRRQVVPASWMKAGPRGSRK